ncbi:hypothetical protein THAOC_00765, partial [Thalassiosira oceanica]
TSLQATSLQGELLRWHYRTGHLPFGKLKQLAINGDIPKYLAKVTPPFCAACIYGAMNKIRRNTSRRSKIFDVNKPGACVSVDQLESSHAGFIAQMKGRLTNDRYRAATIFVDHYSKVRYVYLMKNLTSAETIKAKLAFETWANLHGVTIRHYHCDNGRFADNAFVSACTRHNQAVTFCGVNGHHQNGIAERAIRDLQDQARKQLLFAKARWPLAIDLALWPYALRSAAEYHNQLRTDSTGKSPIEKFANTNVGPNMHHMHTFGCPAYALNDRLASGNSAPKWSPRARLGINLGRSPRHARSVYLILNPATGLVSPQYHIKFDEFFESVHVIDDDTGLSDWKKLSGLIAVDHDIPTVQPNTGNDNYTPILENDNLNAIDAQHDTELDQRLNQDVQETQHDRSVHGTDSSDPIQGAHADDDTPANVTKSATSSATSGTSASSRGSHNTAGHAPSTSSRGRRRQPNVRLGDYVASTAESAQTDSPSFDAQCDMDYDEAHDEHLALQERMRDPIAFAAEMDNDIMYYHQAMAQSDADKFREAVVKEIEGHVKNENWILIPRSEVPQYEEILDSVWAMRRKRNLTTNEITKYKARLNVHGGMQTYGLNYTETYAPVVTWFSIRLLLIIAIMQNWTVRQVDFVMAYTQAPIEQDMYMKLPPGVSTAFGDKKDYVLKLQQNLYGQKQAGRVWNQFLVNKLRALGFEQSKVDECVFYRGTTIFIVYVDDGLVFDTSGKNLDDFIQELRDADLDIEDQGDPNDYVGVNITKDKHGYLNFNQLALIDAIIKDTRYRLNTFFDFNYRSAVGKLNYLAQTTRPDIMAATHMIAKYSHCPKKEHGEAIIHLVQYLKSTRHIGLRFAPDQSKGFENYCDADFSGNWFRDQAQFDPSTSKSRSGWIIFYAGCPVTWASKLQTQVALSTTEAEYIALSQSLRDVIPIMELMIELKNRGFPVYCTSPIVHCKTFEDNSGALELGTLPKMRPRTKHINICYHHFREHVRKGYININAIGTENQTADILTKNLPQNLFVRHRKSTCGQ